MHGAGRIGVGPLFMYGELDDSTVLPSPGVGTDNAPAEVLLIVSVHTAELPAPAALRFSRARRRPDGGAGLRYAEALLAVPFSERVLPSASPGRVGLVGVWDDDAALDRFLAHDPLAQQLADGWHVRLAPLRASGNWSIFGEPGRVDHDPDEPVAVVTYGYLRARKAYTFLRTSARAEAAALASPALLAGTALARPPLLVGTFSLWRSAREMEAYAYGGDPHRAAMDGMREHQFHRQYTFARFRPYASSGTWGAADPLAAGAPPA